MKTMLEPVAASNLELLAEGRAPAGSTVMEQIALSQAISLKRIADALAGTESITGIRDMLDHKIYGRGQ